METYLAVFVLVCSTMAFFWFAGLIISDVFKRRKRQVDSEDSNS